jgi:hypothetical protein
MKRQVPWFDGNGQDAETGAADPGHPNRETSREESRLRTADP